MSRKTRVVLTLALVTALNVPVYVSAAPREPREPRFGKIVRIIRGWLYRPIVSDEGPQYPKP